MVGFFLNIYMAATWCIQGKKNFKKVRPQLRFCVYGGILVGLVDTIPVLALKHDLPCGCKTEECTGSSALCTINRTSVYILLAIMLHLALLTHDLYYAVKDRVFEGNRLRFDYFATAFPLVLMVIGFAVDTDDPDADNYLLNTIRHGFKCSVRFPDMVMEWGLLWIHFGEPNPEWMVFLFLSLTRPWSLLFATFLRSCVPPAPPPPPTFIYMSPSRNF
jgi:hypothetical protein